MAASPTGAIPAALYRLLMSVKRLCVNDPIPKGIGSSTEHIPHVASRVFVTPNAKLVGDVVVGENSSIWYGARILGQGSRVEIGEQVSVGDNAVVSGPTKIGNSATVGHGAKLHGCTLEPHASVEIAAEVGEGAVVESFAVVAAGSKVSPKTRIPSGQIWSGSPAAFVRALTDDEKESIKQAAHNWYALGQRHLQSQDRPDWRKEIDAMQHRVADEEFTEELYKAKYKF